MTMAVSFRVRLRVPARAISWYGDPGKLRLYSISYSPLTPHFQAAAFLGFPYKTNLQFRLVQYDQYYYLHIRNNPFISNSFTMPLVCTLSFSTVTQYGRGAIHLFRVNFAILSFAIITGLFGLCNIINLSHADLGPPTTNEGIRRARKVTKFWLDTYDIGPAIATLLFSLYAIYRWTTSRMSAPLGVLAKVGLVVWWCVALHVQCRGDDWNVWKEYYGWTMYKTQGENPQRLYTQQVERTRTNQPTHVFMVVGGFITVIL